MSHNDKDDLIGYLDQELNNPAKPPLRSIISRGSKAIRVKKQDPKTGEWREVIRMSRRLFDDEAKQIFLEEYGKWGRMGEAASAAGVSTQTVRKALEDDEDFAESVMVQEEEYRTKLIGHTQNLIFNGVEKENYDRNGNLVSVTREYPIRLIELELKAHDERYRDKQKIDMNVSGGVLVAPAEHGSIDDWERKFGRPGDNAKDITPGTTESVGLIEEDDDDR